MSSIIGSPIRVCRSLSRGTRYPDVKNSSFEIQDEYRPELGVWCNDSKLFTLEGTKAAWDTLVPSGNKKSSCLLGNSICKS